MPNFDKNDASFTRASLPLACRVATNHRYLHNEHYKNVVYDRLRDAYEKDVTAEYGFFAKHLTPTRECATVKFALLMLKAQLQTGTFK